MLLDEGYYVIWLCDVCSGVVKLFEEVCDELVKEV